MAAMRPGPAAAPALQGGAVWRHMYIYIYIYIHIIVYSIVLSFTVLLSGTVYYIISYYIMLYYIMLYYIILDVYLLPGRRARRRARRSRRRSRRRRSHVQYVFRMLEAVFRRQRKTQTVLKSWHFDFNF